MTPYPETHTGTSGRRIVRVGSLQALLGAALVWLPFAIAAQPTGLLLSGAALAVTGVLLALLAGLGGRATHAGSPPAAARCAIAPAEWVSYASATPMLPDDPAPEPRRRCSPPRSRADPSFQ